jgi:hypothetical protein
MYDYSAYIPDMSDHDCRRARQRQPKARYEARLHNGEWRSEAFGLAESAAADAR